MSENGTPPPVTERPISAEDRRIMAEYDEIRRGVGLLLLAWANVENTLVRILAAIIRNPTFEIASAIYFAPFGIDARLKIVDKAFRAVGLPDHIKQDLHHEWLGEINCIARLKNVRNKAAHGELTLRPTRRGKFSPRLTWPMFAFDDDEVDSFLAGQLPGMGSNELRQSQEAVENAAKRLGRFVTYIRLARSGNFPTLHQRLAEAKAANQK